MGSVVALVPPNAEEVLALAIAAHLGRPEHESDEAADLEFGKAALKLLANAGLAVIPRVPTKAMIAAADDAWCNDGDVADVLLATIRTVETPQ